MDTEKPDRWGILMGRFRKIEAMQTKTANLMNCIVFGGELPAPIKEQIRSPEGQLKLKKRIEKAEKIKLNIVIALYGEK